MDSPIEVLDNLLAQADAATAAGRYAEAGTLYRAISEAIRRWIDQAAAQQDERREGWRLAKQKPAQLSLEQGWAGVESVRERGRAKGQRDRMRAFLARAVFLYWQATMNHNGALLDPTRERVIMARLRESNDDASELFYAIDGAAKDDWLMGRDPRSKGKRWDGIATLFRDREQVERLAERCPGREYGEPHPRIDDFLRAVAGEGP